TGSFSAGGGAGSGRGETSDHGGTCKRAGLAWGGAGDAPGPPPGGGLPSGPGWRPGRGRLRPGRSGGPDQRIGGSGGRPAQPAGGLGPGGGPERHGRFPAE